MDPSGKSYTADEFIKANAMVFDYLLMDENTQVNGLLGIIDFTGMDIKHTTFFGIARNKKVAEVVQVGYIDFLFVTPPPNKNIILVEE